MTDIFVSPKNKSSTDSVLDKKPEEKVVPILKDANEMSFLSSFCQNPKEMSFQTQKPGESIILFLRSHFVTNLSWIVISIILIVLPLIISIFLPSMHLTFLSQETISRFTIVFVLFYYLMIFSYIFISFLTWFYNVFIVSTERILDIDYSDIVVHNMAETKLSHVEDVRYVQSGFIPGLLDYGNLFVQTAGTEENFESLSIPTPKKAVDIIVELTGK